MKKFLLFFSLIGFTSTLAFGQADSTKNDPMPSVVIKDLNGKDVDLKTLANGQITVISFWATWCAPCKKELDNINEVIDEWREKYDVQVVAISIDDSRNAMKVKPYVQGKKWDFTVLLDVNQDTKRALNYPNVPYSLLVDKNGNIVYKHLGYEDGAEDELEQEIARLK
jgi:cytochrome c biogenesis protein CcmG, thiol:disulfide interchange protein DsbE